MFPYVLARKRSVGEREDAFLVPPCCLKCFWQRFIALWHTTRKVFQVEEPSFIDIICAVIACVGKKTYDHLFYRRGVLPPHHLIPLKIFVLVHLKHCIGVLDLYYNTIFMLLKRTSLKWEVLFTMRNIWRSCM